jgi:hypothetical protein
MFRGVWKALTNFNPTVLNGPWPCVEQFYVVAEPTNVQKCMEVYYKHNVLATRSSQWPHVVRRGSAAARLLGLRVRIPPHHAYLSIVGAVCCQVEFTVSGWSLVQGISTDCSVSLCDDREGSVMRRTWPLGLLHHVKYGLHIWTTQVPMLCDVPPWRWQHKWPKYAEGLLCL